VAHPSAARTVEANPISTSTLSGVVEIVEPAGAVVVDGGIVGPPPRPDHRTHLYLAGSAGATAAVAELFDGSGVTPLVLGERLGAGSAAKQAYALFNKGRMVLAAAAALAEAHGVLDVLAAENDRPGAEILAEQAAVRNRLVEVGWRWAPEFAEIATAFADAGLDPGIARSLEEALRHAEQ
jgi:hypothetical protein